MIEVLTAQHVPHALSQFLELRVSFSADGHSLFKTGMVLDYEEDRQLLSFAVFNLAPEELPLLRHNVTIEINPGDNCLLWGWTAIAALSRSSIAVIDCLSCPAILQAILKSLHKNNNRLFINVLPTHTQYARELSEEYRKLISYVPNFSDLAREHTFAGVVALGTIASLQDWFKYNSMRCHYFAALIV
jgi:hypothetical protein